MELALYGDPFLIITKYLALPSLLALRLVNRRFHDNLTLQLVNQTCLQQIHLKLEAYLGADLPEFLEVLEKDKAVVTGNLIYNVLSSGSLLPFEESLIIFLPRIHKVLPSECDLFLHRKFPHNESFNRSRDPAIAGTLRRTNFRRGEFTVKLRILNFLSEGFLKFVRDKYLDFDLRKQFLSFNQSILELQLNSPSIFCNRSFTFQWTENFNKSVKRARKCRALGWEITLPSLTLQELSENYFGEKEICRYIRAEDKGNDLEREAKVFATLEPSFLGDIATEILLENDAKLTCRPDCPLCTFYPQCYHLSFPEFVLILGEER